jgi:hypothetical protein
MFGLSQRTSAMAIQDDIEVIVTVTQFVEHLDHMLSHGQFVQAKDDF